MSDDLMKRAQNLDEMRSKKINEKLTLDEAQKIVNVWGQFLEYSGGIRMIFGNDIPESLLPYPIEILQGALNKMEAYYFSSGDGDKVKLLEGTEMMLIQFTDDESAIKELHSRLGNSEYLELLVGKFKKYQNDQIRNGYVVKGSVWSLTDSRISELRDE